MIQNKITYSMLIETRILTA